jgi:hypothetical protein
VVRWYDFVPEALLGAGLLVFLVDQTDAATSAFKSGRALALMAAVGVGWVIARVAMHRFLPARAVRTTLFGVAAVAVLAVVVIPAYDDDTVVETFPVAAPAAATSPSSTAPPPTVATTTSSVPATATTAPPTPSTTVAPVTTAATPAPVAVRRGEFRGIDHEAEGDVVVYRQPGGGFVVGLEDFDIQPGPDYDLYLVPGADREDKDGGTRLDDLRGNRGTQYYDVPAGHDLATGDWTVLVWCQTFAVPVANATPV